MCVCDVCVVYVWCGVCDMWYVMCVWCVYVWCGVFVMCVCVCVAFCKLLAVYSEQYLAPALTTKLEYTPFRLPPTAYTIHL